MFETILGLAVLGFFGAVAINVIPLIIAALVGASQSKKDEDEPPKNS